MRGAPSQNRDRCVNQDFWITSDTGMFKRLTLWDIPSLLITASAEESLLEMFHIALKEAW